MSVGQLIDLGCDEAIKVKYGSKPDLCSFLKHHPRKSVLKNNLLRELHNNKYLNYNSKADMEKKRKMVREVIKDFTLAFCDLAIREAEIKHGRV